MRLQIFVFMAMGALLSACNQKPAATVEPFPYKVTEKTKDRELSAAMHRSFYQYSGISTAENELYTQFKYTRLEGLDYHDHDGSISRRDPSKIIYENGKYYVWYTYRNTSSIPMGPEKCNDTIPSTDWDLCEIWYATSEDGFFWEEQGVAVPRPPKPNVGWRSVSTTDILKWKDKYYLYYQGFMEASGKRGDYCPVALSYADSPDGPWTPTHEIIIPNGPEGSWDQYAIHDPYPLVHEGKIYLYYKSAFNRPGNVWVAGGLAIAEDPLGPFEKHPLNPVLNSGHEVSLFPFKEGVAAIMVKDGNEHYTINYASDWVNFQVASYCELVPIAPGPFVPDAFTNTTNGQGISWGLSHFTNAGKNGVNQHSILARFDCDLSQDLNDPVMKKTGVWHHPDVYFKQGLNEKQRKGRSGPYSTVSNPALPEIVGDYVLIYKPQADVFTLEDTEYYRKGATYSTWKTNDHTYLKGPDNRWHSFGITKPDEAEGDGVHEGEGLCYHALAPEGSLEDAFRPESWVDQSKFNTSGSGWAPYGIKIGDEYSLISSNKGQASSMDLYTWEDKGELAIKGGGRDPNIMYWEDTYYLVRCNDRSVSLVTSTDFVNWTEPIDIYTAPVETWNCESPILMRYNSTFYLIWCLWDSGGSGDELPATYDGHDPSTYDYRSYVYVSNDPTNFRNRKPVAELKAHAPEIIQDEKGNYYISSADYPQRGINLARLEWNKANK